MDTISRNEPIAKIIKSEDVILLIFACFFITCQLSANICAQVPWNIFGIFVIPGGTGFIHGTLIIGDIVTETYGYSYNRTIVYICNAFNLLFALFISTVGFYKIQHGWENQEAFFAITTMSWKTCFSSTVSAIVSELANSKIMSFLKRFHKGKKESFRFLVSSFVGSAVDNFIFVPLVFPSMDFRERLYVAFSLVSVRMAIDILAIPIKKICTKKLKTKYNLDSYDQPVQLMKGVKKLLEKGKIYLAFKS